MTDALPLQVESQVQVLTSDAALRRVVQSQDLENDPEFARRPSLLSVLMGRDMIPGGTLSSTGFVSGRSKSRRSSR